eukprot:9105322-Pyramimonas_sp.AAC.1
MGTELRRQIDPARINGFPQPPTANEVVQGGGGPLTKMSMTSRIDELALKTNLLLSSSHGETLKSPPTTKLEQHAEAQAPTQLKSSRLRSVKPSPSC